MENKVKGFRSREDFMAFVRTRSAVPDKDDLIVQLCQGRSVLDIGCIDHDLATVASLGTRWLHARIRSAARETVGLDILGREAEELNRRGYAIHVADAQDFDLGRTFDVIVAGDIIEHLENIGSFLRCVGHHMHAESVCVITTPNPFNVEAFVTAITRNYVEVNPQHTVWIDPKVMYQLISRTDLTIVDFSWLRTRFSDTARPGFKWALARFFGEWVKARRPVCRTDYAVMLMKKQKD